MGRIESAFARAQSRGERALVAYVMAGYPSDESTLEVVDGLLRAGTDMIELGYPFSDPVADGPIIQEAAAASLGAGMNLHRYMSLAGKIRTMTDIPLVLMTYTNILYRRGYREFLSTARDAGMDGAVLPDMPPEESSEYAAAARRLGMDTIFLASPNTTEERLQNIVRISTGFLYLVAVYGTTGSKAQVSGYTIDAIKRTKSICRDRVPLGVGFGVSGPEDVSRYVDAGADAVIVGSALVRIAGEVPAASLSESVREFAQSLKDATR